MHIKCHLLYHFKLDFGENGSAGYFIGCFNIEMDLKSNKPAKLIDSSIVLSLYV